VFTLSPHMLSCLSFVFFSLLPRPPGSTLFPYTTLFRSLVLPMLVSCPAGNAPSRLIAYGEGVRFWTGLNAADPCTPSSNQIRSRSEEHTSEPSHVKISYAVFCLKKKKKTNNNIYNIYNN